MKISLFIFCAISCSLYSCVRSNQDNGKYHNLPHQYDAYFNCNNLRAARQLNDTSYFREYLSFLKSTTRLDDDEFFNEAGGICKETGFYFGLYDVYDSSWTKLSVAQQHQEKANVLKVQHLYLKSTIAFSSRPNSEDLFQDWYHHNFGNAIINIDSINDEFWLQKIDSLYK